MIHAIAQNRKCRADGSLALHVPEVMESLLLSSEKGNMSSFKQRVNGLNNG